MIPKILPHFIPKVTFPHLCTIRSHLWGRGFIVLSLRRCPFRRRCTAKRCRASNCDLREYAAGRRFIVAYPRRLDQGHNLCTKCAALLPSADGVLYGVDETRVRRHPLLNLSLHSQHFVKKGFSFGAFGLRGRGAIGRTHEGDGITRSLQGRR